MDNVKKTYGDIAATKKSGKKRTTTKGTNIHESRVAPRNTSIPQGGITMHTSKFHK
jgi:hypothetical protein